MGTDWSAYSVIGIKLDDQKLFRKVMVKAFEHNRPESMKFDPDTGKKLWQEQDKAVIALPEFRYRDEKQLQDWIMPDGTIVDMFTGTDGRPIYVGVGVKTGSNRNGDTDAFTTKLPDVEELKKFLKSKLEPAGLWDEQSFGMYAILYCSY